MKKYYLIGEWHGTNECPEAFLDIITKENIKKCALEFDKSEQNELDNFFKSKIKADEMSIFDIEDGRGSPAMKKLIMTLKDLNIETHFVDVGGLHSERDKNMAKELKSIGGKVAYLCGNSHASRKPFILDKKSEWYKSYRNGKVMTCGSFLPKDEVVSYKIVPSKGGTFYNNQIREIKPTSELGSKDITEFPAIIKSPDEHYDFFYVVEKFTYSN